LALVRGFEVAGEAMLKATACAIKAKTKRAESVTQLSSRLPPFRLGLNLRAGSKRSLLTVNQIMTAPHLFVLDMKEVATCSKRANPKGAESTTGDVPAMIEDVALLAGVVDKKAAAAIVAVASSVEAATQFSLVLWMTERNTKFVEAMSKLATFCILAEPHS